MWTAPIGTFGTIGFTLGRLGLGSPQALAWLLGQF
jgi:Na+/H+-dicarboxylate symporter